MSTLPLMLGQSLTEDCCHQVSPSSTAPPLATLFTLHPRISALNQHNTAGEIINKNYQHLEQSYNWGIIKNILFTEVYSEATESSDKNTSAPLSE